MQRWPMEFPKDLFNWPTSVCVADPEQDDCPLIYVNASFCRMTEYPAVEVIGRNCRFLQGEGTDLGEVERFGRSIRGVGVGSATLLNYTKSRRPFLNAIFVQTLRTVGGARYLLALQFDITDAAMLREAA
ncbi:MAG: PAS domain-containing protein [Pseudomonadota bacterium]